MLNFILTYLLSLGGALSTLLSFKLAGSSKMDAHLDGRPIYNISFASPMVGGETFKGAFEVRLTV